MLNMAGDLPKQVDLTSGRPVYTGDPWVAVSLIYYLVIWVWIMEAVRKKLRDKFCGWDMVGWIVLPFLLERPGIELDIFDTSQARKNPLSNFSPRSCYMQSRSLWWCLRRKCGTSGWRVEMPAFGHNSVAMTCCMAISMPSPTIWVRCFTDLFFAHSSGSQGCWQPCLWGHRKIQVMRGQSPSFVFFVPESGREGFFQKKRCH